MLKKIKIAAASLAALMLAILAVNLVMAATTATNTPSIAANKLGAPENVTP